MTLPHITAAGDDREIGIAIGRQSGPGLGDLLGRSPRFRALRPWLGTARLAALEAASRAVYPRHVRAIEGIAEGGGMDFAEVFLWNCRGDLPPAENAAVEKDAGTEGCTTVLVPGTDGAPAVIAHNEDGARDFDGHCFLVTATPEEGRGFTSFCYPGLLPGHSFAVNDAGLVQTINHIRAHDMQPGLPRHIVCRAVLDCATLDDALAVLGRRDRASAFHHNLMQAGDARLLSVEAPASGCDVVAVTAARAHANHLLRFPGVDQTVSPSSADRQRRADALLAGDGAADPLRVLGDREDGAWPICRKEKHGRDRGFTLATAVFEAGADSVAWRVHDDLAAPPVRHGVVRPAPMAA